jgi:hypothetical protein
MIESRKTKSKEQEIVDKNVDKERDIHRRVGRRAKNDGDSFLSEFMIPDFETQKRVLKLSKDDEKNLYEMFEDKPDKYVHVDPKSEAAKTRKLENSLIRNSVKSRRAFVKDKKKIESLPVEQLKPSMLKYLEFQAKYNNKPLSVQDIVDVQPVIDNSSEVIEFKVENWIVDDVKVSLLDHNIQHFDVEHKSSDDRPVFVKGVRGLNRRQRKLMLDF